MSKSRKSSSDSSDPALGFFGGLGSLIEKLSELAEKGKDLQELQEFGDGKKVQGVYGFRIRSGLGGDREGGVAVEPFGNVRKDAQTGKATVHEVTEPMVDLFEEPDHILVVAEMPGVGEDDVQVELRDDILEIAAERRDRKYHKEVLLPASFTAEQMTRTCRNGILEIRLAKR